MRYPIAGVMAMLIAAALAGCGGPELLSSVEVRGTVVDVRGETVPGVVVTLAEPFRQSLTNVLGEYSIRAMPGRVELGFTKTGYTSGALVIDDARPGTVAATPIALWRLPQAAGLFLYEDYDYRRAAPLMPRPFVNEEGMVVYGAAMLTGIVETADPLPVLLCHRMPWYDAKLCRLKTVEAGPPEAPTLKKDVWVRDRSLPLAMTPVDEPDRLLWEVRLMAPIEPGIYALHWGALEGYTATDERMFVFAVAEESGESSVPPGAVPEPLPAPEDGEAREDNADASGGEAGDAQ